MAVRNWAWSSTRFAIDVAGLSDFKRQCGKDCVGESLREATCCRASVQIQSEMESRWKANGVFLGKLDLSDEAIVGVEQMIIADVIVCCSTEPNSFMALALLMKTDQYNILKEKLCSIQRSVHVMKACLGPCWYICCVCGRMFVTAAWLSQRLGKLLIGTLH